jgi:hypothetical protein
MWLNVCAREFTAAIPGIILAEQPLAPLGNYTVHSTTP